MAFPTNIETFKSNWQPGETRGMHADQHNAIALLLQAIQTKIGINGSTDTWSIQYFIANHSHSNFYTKTEIDAALAGKQTSLWYAPENVANRWVASWYAPLGSDSLIPQQYINLQNIGKWTQSAQLWEALASPWYGSNDTNNFALPWSIPGAFTVMGWRVRFDKRTRIVSASWKTNAVNGSAAFVIQKDDNIVLGTFPVANGTNIANWINFVCEPGVAYQIGVNSTSNFGNRGERALTQDEINKGFISWCYNNGNFNTMWRIEQLVIQTEEPAAVALTVINKIQYDFTYTLTSVSTASREWVRFTVPYDVLLREVRTHVNASTTSAIILLLDSAGNTLTSQAMTNGTSTVNFGGYALTAWTEYRLVVNDTSNWGTTRYYGSVAQFQAEFPYALSGIQGAGAGTVDNTNILNIKWIELDFQWKAVIAKAIRANEPQFCNIMGFASGPKAKWDTVLLEANKNSIISGMAWLTPGWMYYLGNGWGNIQLVPGTYSVPVGRARSATQLELTSDGFPIINTIWDTTVGTIAGATVFTRPRYIWEGLIMYTLTANTGANSGMRMQWSPDWDRSGNWYDMWETSWSTITERRMMVNKWFIRLKEILPGNPALTATMTIWQ